jgi:ribosomal protein L40E
MDVEKFNNELKNKVALAKSYEKRNEIASAIKIWIEVSEMTLKFSKSRNIDASYKNMLINRTKGIFAHVKNLKAGQIEKPLFEEEIFIQEDDIQDNLNTEMGEIEEIASHKLKAEEIKTTQSAIHDDKKIENDSEFKTVPTGFKEIQPKDFKIITPHDDDYVKKRLNQVQHSDLFKQQGESQSKDERFEFEDEDSKDLICFACGYDKNPKNAKTCKSCGTELN